MPLTLSGTSGVLDNSGAFIAGTAVNSTSGTSIDFTGIPSWVKRVTINFNNVSTNGTAVVMVQIGTSSGVETSGYDSNVSTNVGAPGSSFTKTSTTAGVELAYDQGSATLYGGCFTWNLLGSNLWCCNFVLSANNEARLFLGAGIKSLASTLDRVRITTTNGTDAFDAGSINILYE